MVISRLMISLVVMVAFSCQRSGTDDDEHGQSHQPKSAVVAYTVYSGKTELFVEFKPLVVGQSSRFAAHFTKLGETFTPLDEGTVTLSLVVNDKGIRTSADKPSSPGIFRLSLKPTAAGTAKLIVDIKTKEYTDRIVIDPVKVYGTVEEAEAMEANKPEGDLTFLKEQAWKIEFANEQIKPQTFHEVIRVAGQLSASPSDEQVVAAKSNGTVKWSEGVVTGARVSEGQQLFVLSSAGLAQGNMESQYREARSNFEKAASDYKRVQPLLADKIISEKDYLDIKNRYEQSRIQFETLSGNYTPGGQAVRSPMTGFIKQVSVRSGEFVHAGQPLAVITNDQSLQLQAEVPLRYASQLPLIAEARFKTLHDNKVYSTKELNGKVLSYGKAIRDASSLLPIHFSLSNNGFLIPGDAVEVYLQSRPIQNALVVPVKALIEEQGNFYVYVQTAGESFEKRLVTLGAQDGIHVQILSGLTAGERVVTKGAYMIKLATQSGSVPSHGHEH